MQIEPIRVKKILYATDLSESARHAFAYAISLADLYQAQLVLLHVLTEIPSLDKKVVGYIGSSQWEEIKQRHMEDARESLTGKLKGRGAVREVLDQFSEAAQASLQDSSEVANEVIVRRGNPVDQIIEVAEQSGCDLIVMGTHGHGNLAEAMLGSTARRVLKRSDIPVLVVRLTAD